MLFSIVPSGFLVAMLGLSVGQAQFLSMDYRLGARKEERSRAEHEHRRQLEAAYEARRARAHTRLGSAASSVEPHALCPAFVGPTSAKRTFGRNGKIPIRPFVPRSALRPATPRWNDSAPASESPASLFADYISQQVVQARCINCHVEGGVSGHTRLVLTPSSAEGHESLNLAVFENLVATVEDGADLVLNKIQGVGHGGGIQVPAGSADFANMERFLRLLGGDGGTTGGLSPETLFDGVTMASPVRTLRKAALIFAGRLPSQAELSAASDGRISSLRSTIRSLMRGPGFHEYLIRASNDRLLTDRHLDDVLRPQEGFFVDLANEHWERAKAAVERGYEDFNDDIAFRHWEGAVWFGVARAPLELIAHVVENDLPYTEILTADYVMANPFSARAYGATTQFDNANDPHEFKPSSIARYFRDDESKIRIEDDDLDAVWIVNPGNLSTEYPHAGILNTTVFLLRYPTTATNRNRARSRWTYYHFLGLDVEKSAARTTDPEALADTENPTMKNPACTVCHTVLDPVAGAYQNYGEEGLYRDSWGGLDSLAGLYKFPSDGSESPYRRGDTWYRDMRHPGFDGEVAASADNSLQWLAQRITRDTRFAEAVVRFWWPSIMGVEITPPPEDEGDSGFAAQLAASAAQLAEVRRLADGFRNGIAGGKPFNIRDLLTGITLSPWFRAASVASDDPLQAEALRLAGVERLLTPEELERKTEAITGYVWGRSLSQDVQDMQSSYLDAPRANRARYELMYGGIDSDGITVRAGDVTPLMAAVAQRHAIEVSCPIVLRDFFLLPDENRFLFGGIDRTVSPLSEVQDAFVIEAASWTERETNSLSVALSAGTKTVRLRFPNNFWNAETRVTRNLVLDELVVRDRTGSAVAHIELETMEAVNLGRTPERSDGCDGWPHYNNATRRLDGYELNYCLGWFEVPISVPEDGNYTIEVVAFQRAAGDESAKLEVLVESDAATSQGALAIRRKLVDLHERLLGVTAAPDSPDVEAAFQLFVEIWDRKRRSEGGRFGEGVRCSIDDDLFLERIADDTWEFSKWGHSRLNDRGWDLIGDIHRSDPSHVARTWVVVLAYLLTDYRYLHL